MVQLGFYRTWKARINSMLPLNQFQQDGIASSYPILSYTDAGLQVHQFYFAADQVGPDTLLIGPARVLVTMEYETSAIVHTDFEPFSLPLFDAVLYTLSVEERAVHRSEAQRLQGLYDDLLATYPEVPAREQVARFVEVLQRVVPLVLWPYYEALLRDRDRVVY